MVLMIPEAEEGTSLAMPGHFRGEIRLVRFEKSLYV
jgi:hypothetical protein